MTRLAKMLEKYGQDHPQCAALVRDVYLPSRALDLEQ